MKKTSTKATLRNMNEFVDTPNDDNEVIKKIFSRFISNWKLFVISLICCVFGAFLFLRYARPKFKVTAKILVEDDAKGGSSAFGGLDALKDIGGLFSLKSNVDNEVEILKTRTIIKKVVKDLQLNITYYREGRVKAAELYQNSPFRIECFNDSDSMYAGIFTITSLKANKIQLSANDLNFNAEVEVEKPIKTPIGIIIIHQTNYPIGENTYKCVIKSIDETVDAYLDAIDIKVTNRQVTTIDLSLSTTIPKKGEDILNDLMTQYIKANIEERNKTADSTMAFIDNRILLIGRELKDVEHDIQIFKQKNNIADIGEQSKALVDNASDFYKQTSTVDVQLQVVQALEQYLIDDKNHKRIVPTTLITQDAGFISLVGKYNTLQIERDKALLSSTTNNPVIQNMDEQIYNLRQDILNNITNQKTALLLSRKKLRIETGLFQNEIKKVPEKERAFLEYARQQKVKEELYLFLLQKKEETAITKSSSIASARIIDAAQSQALPYFPKKILIFLLASLIGIALPFIFLYIKETASIRVANQADIEKLTQVPIIGEIGHVDNYANNIIKKDPRAPIAEQFRAIRTNLQFILPNANDKVLMTTSSMSGEGKSFVAINLANIFALAGKKVVLVELDLRKPKVSINLGLDNSKGFSNYIISDMEVASIIKPSGMHENFFVVSSGPIPPNPAELIMHQKMKTFIHELKNNFDIIIIDTAPIGLVTDAQLLSNYIDATLYLVRQGYTYKRQLGIPEDIYINKKMKNIYIIVNDVKKADSYGYGYGYRYGAYDAKTKKSWWKRIIRKK